MITLPRFCRLKTGGHQEFKIKLLKQTFTSKENEHFLQMTIV